VKIGREKAEIDQEVGMRQGDNVSPVIFLFLMSAFLETLEKEWKQSGLPETTFKNMTRASKGQLTGPLKNSAKRGLELTSTKSTTLTMEPSSLKQEKTQCWDST
jgi:hypothetical protein